MTMLLVGMMVERTIGVVLRDRKAMQESVLRGLTVVVRKLEEQGY